MAPRAAAHGRFFEGLSVAAGARNLTQARNAGGPAEASQWAAGEARRAAEVTVPSASGARRPGPPGVTVTRPGAPPDGQ